MKLLSLYIRLLIRFLKYYRNAQTRYDIHAPFVADFVEAVIEDRRQYYAFSIIRNLRLRLIRKRTKVRLTDHGAGSKVDGSAQRSIRSIARHSAVHPEAGKMLFRIVQKYQPRVVIELGASLGISTLYQAFGVLNSQVITVEGCSELSLLAEKHFKQLRMKNIRMVSARFEEALPKLLKEVKRLDYCYLDGDHRPSASIDYFETCLPYLHNDSLFVIADIHWSNEMEKAWERIKQHPSVSLSIDLFHFGVLFFRKENRKKEHYTLIKASRKPWRLGIWG